MPSDPLVPVGCFDMGSDNGDDDEQPIQEICFDEPFWIDKYEVTNADYGSIGCEQWSSEPEQPRNCVSWIDAHGFCETRNGRLPTEAEWEYVARGPDGLIYPWGNEFNPDNLVFVLTSNYQTMPVGTFENGASWVGALDILGNVGEWTNSAFMPYPYNASDGREDYDSAAENRVWRGGAFIDHQSFFRTTKRYRGNPSGTDRYGGFRCMRLS